MMALTVIYLKTEKNIADYQNIQKLLLEGYPRNLWPISIKVLILILFEVYSKMFIKRKL